MKKEAKRRKFMGMSTYQLTAVAILVALIVMMTITGIGYIPLTPFKLTILTLPVAIGAAVCGVKAGLILGVAFGLSSFALGIFGLDPLGTLLISFGWKQTVFLFITCVVPRIACGVIPALLHKLLKKKNRTVADAVTCASVALINTALFLGLLWMFFFSEFQGNEKVAEVMGGTIVDNFGLLFMMFAGWNALIEVVINLVLGTAICKALQPTARRLKLDE